MGFLSGGGGSAPIVQAPTYQPDPTLVAQQAAAEAAATAANSKIAAASASQTMGRFMGTQGGRALYTATAAGFGKTLGSANV
jgi:hypothetical protein